VSFRTRLRNYFLDPFKAGTRVDLPLLVVFLCINGLVLCNAILHDPRIGYDAREHLRYISVLSHLRLPTPDESREFFSPPLPYLVPAAARFLTGQGELVAAKAGQLANVLLSLGLTFFLVRSCRLISPGSALSLGTLTFLGILPVYYRSMSFIRGEPYVAFFAVVLLYLILRLATDEHFSSRDAAMLGFFLGLAVLSRQWGFLLVPPVVLVCALLLFQKGQRIFKIVRRISLILIVFAVTGTWFYGLLNLRYDSMMAFNRMGASHFSPANQPVRFYLGTGDGVLFSEPVRPAFRNELVPVLYSDTWGDYWCFFYVYGLDLQRDRFVSGDNIARRSLRRRMHFETNLASAGTYLGRVNVVSLVPSLFFLVAFGMGAQRFRSLLGHPRSTADRPRCAAAFAFLCILSMAIGYGWFLVMFPNPGKGDTIKAVYLLHAFPFLALLGGLLAVRIRKFSVKGYRLVMTGAVVVVVHNLNVMVTSYSLFELFRR
jgi:4-amino-4-deoxy-L-arabinose transferase-like glycosyltransferase